MQNPEDIISKLLALAKGGTENEAALAAAKASEIALKYNIDLLDLQQKGDPPPKVGEDTILNSRKMEIWIGNVFFGVTLLNNCKFYVADHGTHVKYRIVGRKINIITCELTANYLIQEIKRLNTANVSKYNFDAQERKNYRREFRMACSRRLYQRMQELHDSRKTQTGKALLVISNMLAEIDKFCEQLDLKPMKEVTHYIRSIQGQNDGHKVANTISLEQQLGGSHAVRRLGQL